MVSQLSCMLQFLLIIFCQGGRWKSHQRVSLTEQLADVTAMVAYGIDTKGQFYFNLSSEVLNRTWSHMCARWYLPMFLLRDGLLTLMYNVSLMVLMRFWSSLPTILKFFIGTVWPEVLGWSYIGKGAFWCSLNLSKCSWWFSNVLFITLNPVTFISIYDCTIFKDRIFVLWSHEEVLDSHASFKVLLYPMFTAYSLDALTQPFGIRNHHVWILVAFGVVSRIVGASSVVILCWSLGLDHHSVESPCRVLTFCKSFV